MRLFYLFLIFFSHSTDFFKKFQKYLDWNFFNYDIFWHTKLRFSRLILENGLFLWNQSGFTVVSNFSIWNHLCPKVVSSHFGGFFFLDKVSRPKKDQNLAQIHHMLGFIKSSVTEDIIWCIHIQKWADSLTKPQRNAKRSLPTSFSRIVMHYYKPTEV